MRGQHWQLLPEERAQIASATAQTVQALPSAQVEAASGAIEKFAAPVQLFTALGTAIMSRVMLEQSYLAEQKKLAAINNEIKAVNSVPQFETTEPPAAAASRPASGAALLDTAGVYTERTIFSS